ncbi:MAG: hypothetical protein WAL59_26835 [Roseiarcus sp.]
MKLHGIAATLLFVFLGLDAAIAGPCKADIDAEQAKIDAALDQVAKAGKTGVESTAATESRQPTPASIAAAEKALGEGVSIREAMAALERARRADEHGDMSACHAEVTEARKFLRE